MKNIAFAAVAIGLLACAPASQDTTTGTPMASSGATTSSSVATQSTQTTAVATQRTQTTAPPAPKQAEEGRPMSENKDKVAELHTTAGEIDIRFFPDAAPNHVKNFIDLAQKGFFNGTKFHRVIPGFMIQGGDPNTISGAPSTWGTGGSGKHVKAEFNSIPHFRGVVSMARAQDPDSASSQFFIVVKDSNFLDRQYTVFGEVSKGMDVADKIVLAPRGANDRPDNPVSITKIVIRAAKPEEKGPPPK